MKLIVLSNSHTKGISGGEIRFIQIIKRMKDIEKIVITSKSGYSIYKRKGFYAKYIIIDESEIKSIGWLYIKRIFNWLFIDLSKYIDNGTIVYSTSDFLPDVFPSFVLRTQYKIRWIQLVHHIYKNPLKRIGNSFINNLFGYLAQKVSLIFIKHYSDIIIVVNQFIKEELIKLGIKGHKIKVVPNGVDLNYFKTIKKSTEKSYDAVFLGRLNKTKGIFDLIKIWSFVIKSLPSAKLGIIGEGNDDIKKELMVEIKKHNLEKQIELLGYLENDKAFSIIKASKIFVFPSHEEGFGIAVLEAVACGLPVIAWNLNIYSKIFKKIIQIEENNINEFAESIINLLSKKQYEDICIPIEYDWDEIAKIEMDIINSILKRS